MPFVIIILAILFLIFLVRFLVAREKIKRQQEQIQHGNRQFRLLEEKVKKLERELYDSKLDGLRFMLNPHSFRNTLNTIQHLAKSTLQSVESLAGIFDYMLYDAQQRFVPLEKEAKFAQEYLSLYKLRLRPTVNVKHNLNDPAFEAFFKKKSIPPLIFAQFIENAFKHGELESDEAFVHISLEILEPSQIVYSVRNLISPVKSKHKGGLGNVKLKERLDLLYPGKYHLDCSGKEDVYSANLILTLHDQETAVHHS